MDGEAIAAGVHRSSLQTPGWDVTWLANLRDSGKDGLSQPVSAITVPVLIVWGKEDIGVPVTAGQELHARLPQSERTVFPGAGHMVAEEQPDAFNARPIEFLDEARP